ncbi:DUF4926 domain-containing protein [Candidatus Fermentibacteria bacterium]|nr:DUF4926 domain-containing protein [Candidatus Fermentibacteria bacterium]
MTFSVLDTVVLGRDIPDHGLCRGDIGAVVEVYEPDGVEIEFVTGSGRTQALLTLTTSDVRPLAATEILAARSLRAA